MPHVERQLFGSEFDLFNACSDLPSLPCFAPMAGSEGLRTLWAFREGVPALADAEVLAGTFTNGGM
jgi:hypothetical protein